MKDRKPHPLYYPLVLVAIGFAAAVLCLLVIWIRQPEPPPDPTATKFVTATLLPAWTVTPEPTATLVLITPTWTEQPTVTRTPSATLDPWTPSGPPAGFTDVPVPLPTWGREDRDRGCSVHPNAERCWRIRWRR